MSIDLCGKKTYDFNECIEKTKKYIESANTLIKDFFGAEEIKKSDLRNDINGTDFLVTNKNGLHQTVDVKYMHNLSYDANKILIEIKHINLDGSLRRHGWTFEQSKNTDWIVYYFAMDNKIRVIPFLLLRKISVLKIDEWKKKYNVGNVKNKNYITKVIYISIDDYINGEREILL